MSPVENQGPPAATPPRRRLPAAELRNLVGQLSLRSRLLAIQLLALILALTATGVGTQFVLRDFLTGQIDQSLGRDLVQVRRVANIADIRNLKAFLPGELVIQFNFDDGSIPVRPRLDGDAEGSATLPALSSDQARRSGREPYTYNRGREHWRVLVSPVTFDNGTRAGSLVVARSLTGVERAVHTLRLVILIFGFGVVLAVMLLGWAAIRRAFVPLTEVEDTAAAIAAGDLSRRMPEGPEQTEVGRLTRSLNGMLSQIETAFRAREASEARTRRFAADASHELRTPLASIRGFAELYRQGAVREPADVTRTMGRIEQEAIRMGSLVEDLLLLARLDEQQAARQDPIDLAVLAGDAVHDIRGLDPDRPVRLIGLGAGGSMGALVTGDENRLRQVVANLLANAVRHTPAGTGVEVAVGTPATPLGGPGGEAGRALLEVRDHGPGLTPEQAGRVFERFYRIDSSRSRAGGGGSGLGLSIVAAVVGAHAGTVAVTTTPGGGATFRVSLPARTTAPDAEDGQFGQAGEAGEAGERSGSVPQPELLASPAEARPSDNAGRSKG